LKDVAAGTQCEQRFGESGKLHDGEQRRMNRRATFVVHAAFYEDSQALASLRATSRNTDDLIISLERSLDVEPHPVEQMENLRKPLGIGAGSVQADLKSQALYVTYRIGKAGLKGRFAPAEDDCVEQAGAATQEGED
jgi:hypothetical protein